MFAPAATPKPILEKLNAALRLALIDPKVIRNFEQDRLLSLSRTRADDRGGQFLGASGDRALGRSGTRKPHQGSSVTLAGQLTILGMGRALATDTAEASPAAIILPREVLI
jgi:hypothetical protein